MKIGRGKGFGFALAGLALSSAPWLIARYLGIVGAKATAAGFIGGFPLALFGASCIFVPFEGVIKDHTRTVWCIVIGIAIAGVDTYFFGRYLELW